MSGALTPTLAALAKTQIEKRRELPVSGSTLVKVGDKVSASTPVARAELIGDLSIVRLSEELGIEPQEVHEALKVSIGDRVERGTVVCEHTGFFGLFSSRTQSPISGTVEFITDSTGHLGIRAAPKPLELDAYVAGTVIAIEPGKSVTIHSFCSVVQGIFGVGGEQRGKILALEIPPTERVLSSHLPSNLNGTVVVGGCAPTEETLKEAATRGALGFITGSIDDSALRGYLGYDLGMALTGDEKVPMTVIITEGFGVLGMSERVLNILRTRNGDLASINGATQVRAGAVRPEVIIPFVDQNADLTSGADNYSGELKIGLDVRIVRVPYFGTIGKIIDLPVQPVAIESGAVARVVKVEFKDKKVVTVPRANVEIVGM